MKNKKPVVFISEETLKKDKTGVLKFMLSKTRHKVAHFITTEDDAKEVASTLKQNYSLTRKKHYAGILTVNKEYINDAIEQYKPTLFINDGTLVSNNTKCATYSSFFNELHNRK